MLAACTTSTVLQLVRGVKPHARHPIVHLFTLLLLPLEGYWESGTLGLATAKPNARYALCTPSLGHLVHRVEPPLLRCGQDGRDARSNDRSG